MKTSYDTTILTNPATYAEGSEFKKFFHSGVLAWAYDHHPELKIAYPKIGDFKAAFRAGQLPAIAAEILDEAFAEQDAEALKLNSARQAALKIWGEFTEVFTSRAGWSITVAETEIQVAGEFDSLLNEKIKRLGGYWDGQGYKNRKLWSVPLEKSKSLKTVVKNWLEAKKQESYAAVEKMHARYDAERAERDAAKRQQEADEQAEAAKITRRYYAQANRVKVVAGKYKIGDLLGGRKITGFGKIWSEQVFTGAPEEIFKTQLWESCSCGTEPVYLYQGVMRCEKCLQRAFGKPSQVEFQYAYCD